MRNIFCRKNMREHLPGGTLSFCSRSRGFQRCFGQVVLEYAVLIAIVAAAFIAMSLYIKRAVQGSITSIETRAILPKAGHEPTYFEPNW